MPEVGRPEPTGTAAVELSQPSGLTVADLLKHYTPDFIGRYRPQLASHVESTLARIGFCRTAPLGGRTYGCEECGSRVSIYNSCTDRHCPRCSGARRSDWLDKASELLLEGVTYFQAVFTVPEKLSALMLGNRRELYRVLMHAAYQSLSESLRTERGMQPAALLVLHTWNQRLEHHPHVHALIPGSGPSVDGQRWVECQQTGGTGDRPVKPFLVDNKRLSQRFRQSFIRKLKALWRRDQLELEGSCQVLQEPAAWRELLDSLIEHDWCVFIQPPPTAESSPGQVLKYLARYMTGGPISDGRLVSCENDVVTFMARNKNKHSASGQVPVRLSGMEFTRRWSLHILPKGFTRTRCYGGYSGRYRREFVELCLRLKPPSSEAEPEEPDAAGPMAEADALERSPQCPKCQRPMELYSTTHRPPWRELFYGPDHPAWFES